MKIYAHRITPNSDSPDVSFIEVMVHFWEDETAPYRSAEVTVFIEKSPLSLSEIEAIAIEKARDFLQLAAAIRST